MRVDQLEKPEYRDILLYKIEENGHGDYPFFIQKVTVDHDEGSLHRHDYFQIYYVAKGRLKHRINGKTFGLTKGDLFVIPPYIPHKTFSFDNEHCEALEIEFKPEFINQSFASNADLELFMDFMYIEPFMVNEHQVRPRLRLSGSVEMDVEKIVFDFLHEFEERKPGFELIINPRFSDCLRFSAGKRLRTTVPIYIAIRLNIRNRFSESFNILKSTTRRKYICMTSSNDLSCATVIFAPPSSR